MRSLPQELYTAEQVRQLDKLAINGVAGYSGIAGFELMERAATAAFDCTIQNFLQLEQGASLQVFCGGGNNGGDGFLIAALASEQSILVSVVTLKNPDTLKGDALRAFEYCRDKQVPVNPWNIGTIVSGNVVIDAMLGTGLSGDVQGDYCSAIDAINASGSDVVAVDIPSGLSADTGAVLGTVVKADITVTFIGMKVGLLTGSGPEFCGKLHFTDLDVPAAVYEQVRPVGQRLSQSCFKGLLKPRRRDAHKGHNGHVLILGGNIGMPGAVIMAAETAICCGAGKVSVGTKAEHLTALAIRRPEVMAFSINNRADLQALLKGKSVIVIGPGLGTDQWAYDVLDQALSSDLPLVLDADALNLLSEYPRLRRVRKFPMMITPHPGEAARLLTTDSATVQKNRMKAASDLAQYYKSCVVLKGVGSLIQNEQQMSLCSSGNPGMAVAGMGDVLSGVIGALVAQGLKIPDAARLGVWLHARGADALVREQGEVGMLATEIIPYIRRQLNDLQAV